MRFLDTIGGLWQLLSMAARSRFRLGGAYWRWRRETAFGTDPARLPPWSQRVRQLLAYGRWVHQMKKGIK